MSIIGYKKLNTQGGQSNTYCLTIEADYSGASGGNATVSLGLYIYCKWTATPYYEYHHNVTAYINGTNKYNGALNEPNTAGDWIKSGATIGGEKYNQYCKIGSWSQSVNYGYDNAKAVSCSASYSVDGPANYLPARGTHSVSGSITLPNQPAPKYWLDLNGRLDGSSSGNISGFGTADVYINGALVEDNITDYYEQLKLGTTYEIVPSANTGKQYNGIASGSNGLTGTMNGNRTVILDYTTKTYWNDINVYNPNGSQDYDSGYFNLYVSGSDRTYTDLLNEPSNAEMTQKHGTYFDVYNIRPKYSYYALDSVSGYDSIPSSGRYRKIFNGADEALDIYMKYKNYNLYYNANGGSGAPGSVNYTYHPSNSLTISSTRPSRSGYDFLGWSTSSSASSASYSPGSSFRKNQGKDVTLYAVWRASIPTNVWVTVDKPTINTVEVSWGATGKEMSGYTLAYTEYGVGPQKLKDYSAGTHKATITGLKPETLYEFYIMAHNPGGTTHSSKVTIMTLVDQAKVNIKVDGHWLRGKAYYKTNGQWVKVKKIYIKRDGQWVLGKNEIK